MKNYIEIESIYDFLIQGMLKLFSFNLIMNKDAKTEYEIKILFTKFFIYLILFIYFVYNF